MIALSALRDDESVALSRDLKLTVNLESEGSRQGSSRVARVIATICVKSVNLANLLPALRELCAHTRTCGGEFWGQLEVHEVHLMEQILMA